MNKNCVLLFFIFRVILSIIFINQTAKSALFFLSCMILSKKKKTKHARERKLKLPNHLITSSTSSLLKNANGLNFDSKKSYSAKIIGGSFSDYIKKTHLSTLKSFFKQQAKAFINRIFLVGSVQINFTTFKSDAVHLIFLWFES